MQSSVRSLARRPVARILPGYVYQPLELRRMLAGDGASVANGSILAYEFEHDSWGRVVWESTTMDFDEDGLADARTINHYAYSEDNGWTTLVDTEEYDDGADGTIDWIFTSESVTDAEGRTQSLLSIWDYDADGQVDFRSLQTFEYGAGGEWISLRTDVDEDGDGTFDYWYIDDFDDGGDPGDVGQVEVSEEYDDFDRLIRLTTRFDFDQDGVWDQVDTNFYAYREDSLIATTTEEQDHDGDGFIDYRSVGTHEYDDDGNLLAIHYAIDEDGDGVVEWEYTSDFSFLEPRGEATANLEAGFGNPAPGGQTFHSVAASYALSLNPSLPSIGFGMHTVAMPPVVPAQLADSWALTGAITLEDVAAIEVGFAFRSKNPKSAGKLESGERATEKPGLSDVDQIAKADPSGT